MQFLTEIQFAATGSMESPDIGFITLYVNTDGNIYAETPNGAQTKLSTNLA